MYNKALIIFKNLMKTTNPKEKPLSFTKKCVCVNYCCIIHTHFSKKNT